MPLGLGAVRYGLHRARRMIFPMSSQEGPTDDRRADTRASIWVPACPTSSRVVQRPSGSTAVDQDGCDESRFTGTPSRHPRAANSTSKKVELTGPGQGFDAISRAQF